MTRCGEILPLWQKKFNLLGPFFCNWAKVHWCVRPNIENIIYPSSHTDHNVPISKKWLVLKFPDDSIWTSDIWLWWHTTLPRERWRTLCNWTSHETRWNHSMLKTIITLFVSLPTPPPRRWIWKIWKNKSWSSKWTRSSDYRKSFQFFFERASFSCFWKI